MDQADQLRRMLKGIIGRSERFGFKRKKCFEFQNKQSLECMRGKKNDLAMSNIHLRGQRQQRMRTERDEQFLT